MGVPGSQSSFYNQGGQVVSGASTPSSMYGQLSVPIGALECICDGSGAPIQPGTFGYLEVPYNCTIVSATLIADKSGSCVVDVQRTTGLLFNPPLHPSTGDSLTASAQPTLSASAYYQDNTLTGWTTALTKGDILGIVVNSASTVTRVTLSLKVQRT